MDAVRSLTASLLVLAPIAGAACTGGSSSSSEAASSGGTHAIAQAIFEGRLENGSGTDCKDTGPLFTVGAFGGEGSPSTPVKDGETVTPGVVSVSCSVIASGSDAFDIDGALMLSGAGGGSVAIKGKVRTTGEQTGIYGIFASRASGNTYEQSDRTCIVRYTTAFQGVASGRVWGEITCPKATTAAGDACEVIAQFRFENCTQE